MRTNSNKMKHFTRIPNAHYHRLLISGHKPAIGRKKKAEAHYLGQPFVSYVDIDKETQRAEDS